MSTATSERRRSLLRTRWAAIGAAVAVTLGAGGLYTAQAADDATSGFVSVTPTRALDTRAATNVGLVGKFQAGTERALQITGAIPVVTDTDPFTVENRTVVPSGATAVVMNVTGVRPTSNGFVSIRPGDIGGQPSTSNLNVAAGAVSPNSVTVALPDDGEIGLYFGSASGATIDLVVDIVGFYTSTNFQEQIEALDARISAIEGPAAAQPGSSLTEQIEALDGRLDDVEAAIADLPTEAQQTIPGTEMIADDGSATFYNRSCMFNNTTPISYVPLTLPVGARITEVDVTVKLRTSRLTPEEYSTTFRVEERTGDQVFTTLASARHSYPDDIPAEGRIVTLTPATPIPVAANKTYVVSMAVADFQALSANDRPGICNVTITYDLPR